MGDPRSPQQQATETRRCGSPEKNYRGQEIIGCDSQTHRQTGWTRDIMTGFQAGQSQREHSRTKEPCQNQ